MQILMISVIAMSTLLISFDCCAAFRLLLFILARVSLFKSTSCLIVGVLITPPEGLRDKVEEFRDPWTVTRREEVELQLFLLVRTGIFVVD